MASGDGVAPSFWLTYSSVGTKSLDQTKHAHSSETWDNHEGLYPILPATVATPTSLEGPYRKTLSSYVEFRTPTHELGGLSGFFTLPQNLATSP